MNRYLISVGLLFVLSGLAIRADDPVLQWGNVRGADHDEEWWHEDTAGWIGGLVGGSIGIIGGILGVMAGLGCVPRFVFWACLAMICFGAVALIAGISAVMLGQPSHVFYPLLLIGVILTLVFGINLPIVKRRCDMLQQQQFSQQHA